MSQDGADTKSRTSSRVNVPSRSLRSLNGLVELRLWVVHLVWRGADAAIPGVVLRLGEELALRECGAGTVCAGVLVCWLAEAGWDDGGPADCGALTVTVREG